MLDKQQLKIVNPIKASILLIFVDFNDLKSINDNLGPLEGDSALIEIANLLKDT